MQITAPNVDPFGVVLFTVPVRARCPTFCLAGSLCSAQVLSVFLAGSASSVAMACNFRKSLVPCCTIVLYSLVANGSSLFLKVVANTHMDQVESEESIHEMNEATLSSPVVADETLAVADGIAAPSCPTHTHAILHPLENDVLTGRGAKVNARPGNQKFRALCFAQKAVRDSQQVFDAAALDSLL